MINEKVVKSLVRKLSSEESVNLVSGLLFLKKVFERTITGELGNSLEVPERGRWSRIVASGPSSVKDIVLDVFSQFEYANTDLRGVFPIEAAKKLDSPDLHRVVQEIANVEVVEADLVGSVYESFASSRSKRKVMGEYYTPAVLAQIASRLVGPVEGTIYDPACGSGGLFVRDPKIVQSLLSGKTVAYGQEITRDGWSRCKMNLCSLGVENYIELGDTLNNDKFPDLRADFILANPPFNLNNWRTAISEDDPRFLYGIPKSNNGNWAWIQHILHHLNDTGRAAVIFNIGVLSSKTEADFRKRLLEDNYLEYVALLPNRMFKNTSISTCLMVLNKAKTKDGVLFVDFSKIELPDSGEPSLSDFQEILEVCERWRGCEPLPNNPFAVEATVSEVLDRGASLNPTPFLSSTYNSKRSVLAVKSDIDSLNKDLLKLSNLLNEFIEASRSSDSRSAPLKDLLEVRKPLPASRSSGREEYPVFGSGGIHRYSDTYNYVGPALIAGLKGSIEKVHIAEGKFSCLSTCVPLFSKTDLLIDFLYVVVLSMPLKKLNVGTSIPTLDLDTLLGMKVRIPDEKVQKTVKKIVELTRTAIPQFDQVLHAVGAEFLG